jgi:hypothetical protein
VGGVFLETVLTWMAEVEERWQMEGCISGVCALDDLGFIEMFSISSLQHSVSCDPSSKDALHCG